MKMNGLMDINERKCCPQERPKKKWFYGHRMFILSDLPPWSVDQFKSYKNRKQQTVYSVL